MRLFALLFWSASLCSFVNWFAVPSLSLKWTRVTLRGIVFVFFIKFFVTKLLIVCTVWSDNAWWEWAADCGRAGLSLASSGEWLVVEWVSLLVLFQRGWLCGRLCCGYLLLLLFLSLSAQKLNWNLPGNCYYWGILYSAQLVGEVKSPVLLSLITWAHCTCCKNVCLLRWVCISPQQYNTLSHKETNKPLLSSPLLFDFNDQVAVNTQSLTSLPSSPSLSLSRGDLCV